MNLIPLLVAIAMYFCGVIMGRSVKPDEKPTGHFLAIPAGAEFQSVVTNDNKTITIVLKL